MKDLEEVANQRKNWHHPDYSMVKIGLNTYKSSEDLKRLAVTYTPVKDHRLMQGENSIIEK